MRFAVALIVLTACGGAGASVASLESSSGGTGIGAGLPDAATETALDGASATDATQGGDAGLDASQPDVGVWTGTGNACDADTDCPPGWRWCVRGYCAVWMCSDTNDSRCAEIGGTCRVEERPGIGTPLMCETLH